MVEEIINLLDDHHFKMWILSPNESVDAYWNKILKENPERLEAINKSRLILAALDRKFVVDFPDNETVNKMVGKILLLSGNIRD